MNIAKNLRVLWKLDTEDEGTIILRNFIDYQPVDTKYHSEDQDIQQHCCDSFRSHKEFLDQSNNFSVVWGKLSSFFFYRSALDLGGGVYKVYDESLSQDLQSHNWHCSSVPQHFNTVFWRGIFGRACLEVAFMCDIQLTLGGRLEPVLWPSDYNKRGVKGM